MSGHGGGITPYEHAACALFTLSADGRIARANKAACTWTERPLEELVGVAFQDLLTMGSKLFCQTHWWPLLQMQGSVAEVQLELALPDARTMPLLVNAVRRSDKCIDVAFFIAADRRKYERELLYARRRAEELLDVLRQREDELRTIADNAPDVIVRFDKEHRALFVNRALASLSGIHPAAAVGRHLDELGFDPESREAFRTGLVSAFQGAAVTKDFVLEHPRSGAIHLEARFVPERSLAAGEVVTVLAVTRDVSLLKAQEQQSHQRAVLAEELIGIVSHDLRNPLNAISLGAQMLAEDEGTHQRVATRIVSAANRAARLIEDLLDFTQARLGGGLPVSPVEMDLHAAVAEMLEELRLASPHRTIEHRRVGAGRGIADPDRVAQVVTNLVGNALAYGTPERPIAVTTEVNPNALILRVHNEGEPIPEELQRTIFEPLRRGEQRQRGSRSVGLGLYIVREIAQAHGGRVTLVSTAVAGTTFTVEVPRGVVPRP